jgi:hypothetical protein
MTSSHQPSISMLLTPGLFQVLSEGCSGPGSEGGELGSPFPRVLGTGKSFLVFIPIVS